MNRHLSRTIAMQALYELDMRPEAPVEDVLERNISIYADDVDAEYVRKVVMGILGKTKELDTKITDVAPEWPVEQIAPVDKAILRLAIFELLYDDEVPPKVAINEAVELGKSFGSDSTSRFVNGVLGTLYRQSPKYDPKDDEEKIEEIQPIEETHEEHDEQTQKND